MFKSALYSLIAVGLGFLGAFALGIPATLVFGDNTVQAIVGTGLGMILGLLIGLKIAFKLIDRDVAKYRVARRQEFEKILAEIAAEAREKLERGEYR